MHTALTYHAGLAHIDDVKRQAAAQRQRTHRVARPRLPFRGLALARQVAGTHAGSVAPAPVRTKVA